MQSKNSYAGYAALLLDVAPEMRKGQNIAIQCSKNVDREVAIE
jgi:hypothetical protein